MNLSVTALILRWFLEYTVYLVESMTTEVSISATEQVSEQVRLLLSCLQKGQLGGREAMKCAGLNHGPTFLYDYLQPAIQAGFVEMTQPDSHKSPTQALLVRGMARDLYDLWFLLERGVKPDIELINSKLAIYDKAYSQEEMNERIAELEKGWSKDLRPLLGVVVPYEVSAKRVVEGLMSGVIS
jgi:hypothetical protein